MIRTTEAPKGRTSPPLATFAGDFESLAAVFQVLSEALPGRATTRQALAFLVICYANAMGRSVTMSDLLTTVGKEGLGPSIERTIQIFFAPSLQYPDALGWVDQEPDPYDKRRKYLRLSDEGRIAAKKIIEALHA